MRQWLRRKINSTLPIYCVTAYDTIGQAVFTSSLTHALGVNKLTVITSEYHLPRTRAIFERVHGACCQLTFIGAQHQVENLDAVIKNELASLALFREKFAHATTLFDFTAILFDHHPRYQHIALERADPNPESEDSLCIWSWKNDPLSRQMSRITDVVSWESHREWYATTVRDPKTVIIVACINGIRACMLRFDGRGQGCAEININLNPAMRAKRMSKPILAAACKYGFETLKLSRIYAEIKPENVTSLKIFEAVGFVFEGMREGLRTYNLRT
jgi:RimJ/RimL family protein N-acetyltransferase